MWFSRRARNEINWRRWWDLLQKGGNFFIRTQYKSGTWQIKKDMRRQIVVLTTCMTGADRTVRNTEGWLDFINTSMTNNTDIFEEFWFEEELIDGGDPNHHRKFVKHDSTALRDKHLSKFVHTCVFLLNSTDIIHHGVLCQKKCIKLNPVLIEPRKTRLNFRPLQSPL